MGVHQLDKDGTGQTYSKCLAFRWSRNHELCFFFEHGPSWSNDEEVKDEGGCEPQLLFWKKGDCAEEISALKIQA